MGNSLGGFKEYWDIYRTYPSAQGGFIWDFVDQSSYWRNSDGMEIFAYGGDFNPYDGSDQNFCNNGLIAPDRTLHPEMAEVKRVQQSIWTNPEDIQQGIYNVFNENFFTDLSNYKLDWTVMEDGIPVKSGVVDNLNIGPQKSVKITIPYRDLPNDGEVLLNLAYSLKNADGILAAGTVLANQQIALNQPDRKPIEITNIKEKGRNLPVELNDHRANYLIVKGDNFSIDFNKYNGFISRYKVDGNEMLEKDA